jgi:hypothetical protein
MKTKLCGHIAQIMYETAEVGICPDVKQVIYKEGSLPFHLMTHPDKQKAVLIGLMKDADDSILVKSYAINFNKWNWASHEGFDLEGIFQTKLYNEVFIEIHPATVSSYFVKEH